MVAIGYERKLKTRVSINIKMSKNLFVNNSKAMPTYIIIANFF